MLPSCPVKLSGILDPNVQAPMDLNDGQVSRNCYQMFCIMFPVRDEMMSPVHLSFWSKASWHQCFLQYHVWVETAFVILFFGPRNPVQHRAFMDVSDQQHETGPLAKSE